MAPLVAHFHALAAQHVKLLKAAWNQAGRLLQNHATPWTRAELQPLLARNAPRHPIPPAARLKQSKARWYSSHRLVGTSARRFATTASQSGSGYDGVAFRKTGVGALIHSSPGRAPFASTLRPNLTGGTLNRTAGGYALGGGRVGGPRYFSHGPAAPGHVVQNVAQGLRAFLISGNRLHYDGTDACTGQKRYKCVSALQDQVDRTMAQARKTTPGSWLEFKMRPMVTGSAHSQSERVARGYERDSLNREGLLDALSADFSRAAKEQDGVWKDLKTLSHLGDLPVTLEPWRVRVQFPGCDGEAVERLCVELGVQRGVVHQDQDYDAVVGTDVALMFPFAPSPTRSECTYPAESVSWRQSPIEWQAMMSAQHGGRSDACMTDSEDRLDFDELTELDACRSSPSGFASLHSSELEDSMAFAPERDRHAPCEYQGIQGMVRFMQHCESPA